MREPSRGSSTMRSELLISKCRLTVWGGTVKPQCGFYGMGVEGNSGLMTIRHLERLGDVPFSFRFPDVLIHRDIGLGLGASGPSQA